MISSVIDRINILMDKEGLNKSDLAKSINLEVKTVTNYINGSRKPTLEFVEQIARTFVLYSRDWLLTGEGNIMRTELPLFEPSDEEGEVVPIYSTEASAGLGNNNLSSEFLTNTMRIPFAKQGDIALPVVGDSMAPVIRGGDLIIIREFKSWKDYIPKGKEYVVVTDDSIYVKVVDDYNTNTVKLLSYNKEYREFEIPFRLIRSIYIVIGLVSQRSYSF